jgi:hypothetical protein
LDVEKICKADYDACVFHGWGWYTR